MNEPQQTSLATVCTSGQAGALAAAAAIAGGTLAYAQPVRFENVGGQFVWSNQQLDITRPYNAQPNTAGSSTVMQTVDLTPYPYYPNEPLIAAWAQGSASLAQEFSGTFFGEYWTTVSVSRGITVGGAFNFDGNHARTIAGWGRYGNQSWRSYVFVPRNSVFYLPVRFMNGTDAHYGWIAGEWGGQEGVRALAWGYETTPNTPIAAGAVPAPGTLAALAFGAAAFGRRPNRKACADRNGAK